MTRVQRFLPFEHDWNVLPINLDNWDDSNRLAWFVVDVVDKMDLSSILSRYAGRGKVAYHPKVLISVLFYGYAEGFNSSRKIEKALRSNLNFMYVSGGNKPDHATISDFRCSFIVEIAALSKQVLKQAHEMGLLSDKVSISVDGSKIPANASIHAAHSWGYIQRTEPKIRKELEELYALQNLCALGIESEPKGMNIQDEINRRINRLNKMGVAKEGILKQSKDRDEKNNIVYKAKLALRQAKFEKTGKKPGGKPPAPPVEGPRDKDQYNYTDPESSVQMTARKICIQGWNAQAGVDAKSMLVLYSYITTSQNDKLEVDRHLEEILNPDMAFCMGSGSVFIADCGYFSQANTQSCCQSGVIPYIAIDRQDHHVSWTVRFAPDGPEPQEDADPLTKMIHRLSTKSGKAIYALRKQTIEPVFGNIKENMGWRGMRMRGLKKCQGEWGLATMVWNIKHMNNLLKEKIIKAATLKRARVV